MTPAELSEKLWDNAERVAKFLLPKGHLEGKEWCAGNTNGDSGKSLKVNIGGKKSWADFASGDSGDLLDLWVLVRNCQLHDAMREAKEFLGLKDDDHHFEAKKKTFSRPTKKGVKKASHCYDYLANLAKCGLDEEDYGGQKEFIDTLCDFKNEHNCHVLLVTHARKTNEAAPTGKMDVKGTGALTDMPDNVMAVWRNIPRELAQRKAERMGYESLDKDEQTAIQMPASMIRLLKQREGEGWIGDIGANFDSRSHQFIEGDKGPFNYLAGKQQSELDIEWEATNATRY